MSAARPWPAGPTLGSGDGGDDADEADGVGLKKGLRIPLSWAGQDRPEVEDPVGPDLVDDGFDLVCVCEVEVVELDVAGPVCQAPQVGRTFGDVDRAVTLMMSIPTISAPMNPVPPVMSVVTGGQL